MTGPAHPPLTLHQAARFLGRYRGIERRLFTVVGGWAADEVHAESRILFAAQSHRHAWHAQLWDELVPRVHDLDDGALGTDANDESLLAALDGARETADRLNGLYRAVLPALVAVYEAHERRATVVSDAPVRRVLALVLRDERGDIAAGAGLLDA